MKDSTQLETVVMIVHTLVVAVWIQILVQDAKPDTGDPIVKITVLANATDVHRTGSA